MCQILYNSKACKSITVYMFSENKLKKNKTNEGRWDDRRKLIKLHNHKKMCFLFPFLTIFSSDKFTEHT